MTESNSSLIQTKYNDMESSILQMIRHIETEIERNTSGADGNVSGNKELEIKTSRVLVAIEQTIQKLEIAFCLEWIINENADEMKMLFGKDMDMFFTDYANICDDKNVDVCRIEPNVINCITVAFGLGVGKFVNQHRHKLPEPEIAFLSTMVQFKYMAEWRMSMSAVKALNKEKTLHKMWTVNERMKANIKELEIELQDTAKKLQEMTEEKSHSIAEHNKTIADLEKRNAKEISAEIYKSNKVMYKVCLTSEEKQKILSAKAVQMKENYETLVESNLIIEKKLREQKLKTRQKLQAMLSKYDNGVGERYAELMRVRDELETETVSYENKMKEFELQDIEYNQIMFDKAEVDAKIREEKLILFMMNRSARIIQRAYKKMMKKRKKKKGKKGKKGASTKKK